jgi:hypothetical protein
MVLATGLAGGSRVSAQITYTSQIRQLATSNIDGDLVGQVSSSTGPWNQNVVAGGTPGQQNQIQLQSDISPTAISCSATSTIRAAGSPSLGAAGLFVLSAQFQLSQPADYVLAVSDTLGVTGSGSFSLTGGGGPPVNISGRTLTQNGTLPAGTYTLNYQFTASDPWTGTFGFSLTLGGFPLPPSAITYQGRLDEGGVPMAGFVDVRGGLYAEATGGVPIAAVSEQPNLPLRAGVFTASFDFGDVPWIGADARWLELSVRPTGSGQAYQVLTPRQRVTPSPRALSAVRAGFADYADNSGTASQANFASAAGTAYAIDLFSRGLLRGESGASSESPGLILATPFDNPISRAFMGMADGANVGFFGYAGGGWSLTMRTDNGNVGVGTLTPGTKLEVVGNARAQDFEYATPQTRSLMVGYTDFRMRSNESTVLNNVNFGVAGPALSSTALIATAPLPQGAELLSITFYIRDSDLFGDLRADVLQYNPLVPNFTVIAGQLDMPIATALPTSRTFSIGSGTIADPGNSVIMVQIYPIGTQWGPLDSKTVQAVKFTYQMPKPL